MIMIWLLLGAVILLILLHKKIPVDVPPHYLKMLAIMLIGLSVLDIHSTWIYIKQFGTDIEANPVFKNLFDEVGFFPMAGLKIAITGILSAVAYKLKKPHYLITGNVLMVLVVLNNYSQ